MRRYPSILILLACLALLPAPSAGAWSFSDLFGSDDTLVVIDGAPHTTEDFKRWWGFWNDEGLDLPATPQVYIDWLLLAREGERMELAADPSFQRQSKVFLQSRTLLMLKYEDVDSRIEISEEEIRARYEQGSVPRWQIRRLHFRSQEAAAAAARELAAGELTMAELLERDVEAGGPVAHQENWARPGGIDPGWAAIFSKLEVGQVVDPEEHKGGPLLYQLVASKDGDEEDYARLRDSLHRELWKERETALTLEMLDRLREKYEVKIDEERLAALDVNAPTESLTDAVLISTNRQNLTERDFHTLARRDMAQRPDAAHAAFDEEQARELKERVVSGFIAQSLTNWESVARGYEKREPFKWEYQFHIRHRLTTALERRVFAAGAVVSDEEVYEHYRDNLARYTRPAMVRLHIVDDTQGPVEQIWRNVITGMEFSRALREHLGHNLPAQEVPLNHLDPEIKTVVDSLSSGDTSQPFTARGSRVVVHLISRTPEQPLPLERVTNTIRTRLEQEKTERQRREYLDLLKSRSRIEVRERQWRNLRTELGGSK